MNAKKFAKYVSFGGRMSEVTNVTHAIRLIRPSGYLLAAMLSAMCAALMWSLVPYQVDEAVVLFSFVATGLDPKAFPYLVTSIWFFVSLWNIVAAVREKSEGDESVRVAGDSFISVAFTVIISFLYAFALEPFGFVIASASTVLCLAVFFGSRERIPLLICAVGVPGLIFLVFTRLLYVSLPPFPAWLAGG